MQQIQQINILEKPTVFMDPYSQNLDTWKRDPVRRLSQTDSSAAQTTPFTSNIYKDLQNTLGMANSLVHKQEVEKRSVNERRKCWKTVTIQEEETLPCPHSSVINRNRPHAGLH